MMQCSFWWEGRDMDRAELLRLIGEDIVGQVKSLAVETGTELQSDLALPGAERWGEEP